LQNLKFADIKTLRRFTFRTASLSFYDREPLLKALSTIESQTFCEFVLELDGPLYCFDKQIAEYRSHWESIDEFLGERFANRGDSKLVIRTHKPDGPREGEEFRERVNGAFQALARRGCIHFEKIDTSWP
jgi:hypothetical protein